MTSFEIFSIAAMAFAVAGVGFPAVTALNDVAKYLQSILIELREWRAWLESTTRGGDSLDRFVQRLSNIPTELLRKGLTTGLWSPALKEIVELEIQRREAANRV